MIENLGGLTSEMAKLALDVAAMRQQVIANNIANAGTPNHCPRRLNFEQVFADLAAVEAGGDQRALSREIEVARERISRGELVEESGVTGVELDVESAHLTENALWYQAIITAMSKRSGILKMAISEQIGR